MKSQKKDKLKKTESDNIIKDIFREDEIERTFIKNLFKFFNFKHSQCNLYKHYSSNDVYVLDRELEVDGFKGKVQVCVSVPNRFQENKISIYGKVTTPVLEKTNIKELTRHGKSFYLFKTSSPMEIIADEINKCEKFLEDEIKEHLVKRNLAKSVVEEVLIENGIIKKRSKK